MLTKAAIIKARQSGAITIEPFDRDQLAPAGYRYRLGALYTMVPPAITPPRPPKADERPAYQTLTDRGLVLKPGRVYLFTTLETIGSTSCAMSLMGAPESSRLGLFVHINADLGHTGAAHKWTLELACIQPVRVYPGMVVGCVGFFQPKGTITRYNGRYARYSTPMPIIHP